MSRAAQTLDRRLLRPLSGVVNYAEVKFEDAYFAREDRFSVGVETTSGRHYVSFPVSNRIVDYEEYYVISSAQFATFTATTRRPWSS